MRFSIYILISAASLWFIFGTMFLYRSSWNLKKSKYHVGALTEFNIELVDDPYAGKYAYTFKISGKNSKFGIYQRNNKLYTEFTDNLKVGDTIKLHYHKWNIGPKDINLQVDNFEAKGKTYVDYKVRKSRDMKIALILYGISVLFFSIGWYFNRESRLKKLASQNESDR